MPRKKILWVVNYDDVDAFLQSAQQYGATGVAIRTDNDVLNMIDEIRPVVGDGMEFAGRRVVLRMGGERAGEGVVEPVGAERFEFVAHLHRR